MTCHKDSRIRSVPGLEELAYEDRVRRLKLPILPYCLLRADIIATCKIITGACNSDVIEGLFNVRVDSNTRGEQYKVFNERPRLELRKPTFMF